MYLGSEEGEGEGGRGKGGRGGWLVSVLLLLAAARLIVSIDLNYSLTSTKKKSHGPSIMVP